MIVFSAALLALLGLSETTQHPALPQAPVANSSPVAESGAAQAARQWLALVDAGDWSASWAATASSFQTMNSVEAWEAASAEARVPLGRAMSRRLAGEESIPAPPHGYQLVRFRTRFENRDEATTETLSLAREGANWKVAGYFIDQ